MDWKYAGVIFGTVLLARNVSKPVPHGAVVAGFIFIGEIQHLVEGLGTPTGYAPWPMGALKTPQAPLP